MAPDACSVSTSHVVSDVNKRTLASIFNEMATIKVALQVKIV